MESILGETCCFYASSRCSSGPSYLTDQSPCISADFLCDNEAQCMDKSDEDSFLCQGNMALVCYYCKNWVLNVFSLKYE